ncbi:uncharacterized protein LOC114351384 [Ostrinia furnacalis]|uniref:uncharacterized protein LOC114351384 n=1 Tax=Ostrinia furnacalis TaxID=93504 RepID=UPI00103E7E12|nr:uncharacterized protein LOC114351384 [Ostrinia furnacalis]
MCGVLLLHMQGHPALAAYTFDLFPHRSSQKTTDASPVTAETTRPEKSTSVPQATPLATADAPADIVTILTDTAAPQAATDYEADHSSSDEEDIEMPPDSEAPIQTAVEDNLSTTPCTKVEPPSEPDFLPQITCKSEPEDSDASERSMIIMFEDETIKSEIPEWTRDEDKLILEMLKINLTKEERKDTNKTILETLDEKNVLEVLTESLTNKSYQDVKERMMYLLKLLVLSES